MDHKELEVWKDAIDFVTETYSLTASFPGPEIYGLTSQMRRAAVSVPSNIAEGAARNSDKEFIQFLHISLGSLAEIETQFIIASNLGYLNNINASIGQIEKLRKMLTGLIKYLKNK